MRAINKATGTRAAVDDWRRPSQIGPGSEPTSRRLITGSGLGGDLGPTGRSGVGEADPRSRSRHNPNQDTEYSEAKIVGAVCEAIEILGQGLGRDRQVGFLRRDLVIEVNDRWVEVSGWRRGLRRVRDQI